jgi:uncharacterized tellurite resistance protein B-like protein
VAVETMSNQLREMMGGSLRPSDPRRFLVEAMIGAMTADGVADRRELEVLRGQLADHDLFSGLPDSAADMLIDMGTEAIRFAGEGTRRVGAIAKGLPSRTHRLAAYGMACEVSAAEGGIDAAEQRYLESLRAALSIGERESAVILEGARAGRAMAALEQRVQRLREMWPVLIDCFALHLSAEHPPAEAETIRRVLAELPDVTALPDEIDTAARRSLRDVAARCADLPGELSRLSGELPFPMDRYWCAVYLMMAERAFGRDQWPAVPFFCQLQQSFGLTDVEMERAAQDARLLPPLTSLAT